MFKMEYPYYSIFAKILAVLLYSYLTWITNISNTIIMSVDLIAS